MSLRWGWITFLNILLRLALGSQVWAASYSMPRVSFSPAVSRSIGSYSGSTLRSPSTQAYSGAYSSSYGARITTYSPNLKSTAESANSFSGLGLTQTTMASTRAYGAYSTASRVRAEMRPVQSYASSSYSRYDGFLEPSYAQTVFSPVYFFVPWRVWHLPAALANSSWSATVAALTQADQGDNDLYQRGQVGAPEINALPEWAQASLRLAHTKKTDGLPSDPVIEFKNGRESDWNDTVRNLRALNEGYAALKRELGEQDGIRKAQMRVTQLLASAAPLEVQLNRAQANTDRAGDELHAAESDVHSAQAAVEEAKSAHWICRILTGWWRSCTPEEDKRLEDAKVLERTKNSAFADTFSVSYQLRNQFSQLSYELHKVEPLAARNLLSTPELSQRKQKQGELEAQIEDVRNHLHDLQGFLAVDANSLHFAAGSAPCPNPFIYAGVKGFGGNKHPLFAESVETELVPDESLDLVICVDANKHLTSVHLFGEQRKEIASASIERNDVGAIASLALKNDRNEVVERHDLVKLGDGRIRYSVTFKSGIDDDSDQDEVSIYSDLPAELKLEAPN